MKFKLFPKILFLVIVILILSNDTFAQCPMCKQALLSAREGGESQVGNTINKGILYLLALPYLIGALFIFLYIKNTRVKKQA